MEAALHLSELLHLLFSQTKYDDNFTRQGRAAIFQKQSHTKGFASSFADSLAHSLIKSILKNVSVSVCNLFELLISAFHGPLAE